MRVLVTGASGFLGSHLVARLWQDHDVVALARNPFETKATVVIGDVADPDALSPAMEGCQAVVHAAGGVSHHPDDASQMWRVHVDGTRNVIAAAQRAGVERVVHISSSGTVAVSRDAEKIADETSPEPREIIQHWPYYRAKLYAEHAALDAEGIDVVVLNPSLLLGPGDTRRSSTRSVVDFLEQRVTATPPGGLSFVDVRDVADAAAAALTGGTPGQRYLLGSANMTFATFFAKLGRLSGIRPPRLTLPRATRKVLGWLPELGKDGIGRSPIDRHDLDLACHTWYLDDRRARADLGWNPRDPMDTLRETIADLRS